VDAVLLIGEHGDYPHNERGRHQYPRRYFFEQISGVLAENKTSLPVFVDKHFAYSTADALWMWERAKTLGIPLMAVCNACSDNARTRLLKKNETFFFLSLRARPYQRCGGPRPLSSTRWRSSLREQSRSGTVSPRRYNHLSLRLLQPRTCCCGWDLA
jgi:hypothetical protein